MRRWMMSGWQPLRLAVALAAAGLVDGVPKTHAQRAVQPPAATPAAKTTEPDEIRTDIFETVAKVAVSVKLADGRAHSGEMVVTHYRPKGAGPFPLVILQHGRGDARAEPKRFRSIGTLRFWTRRGFAVIIPTRLGYGDSGQQPDPDSAGRDCANRTYVPAMAAMLAQTDAAFAFARTLPWVDGTQLIIVGQSYGGFAAVGASGHGIPGLLGAINFAGGGGGNPKSRPANPCGTDKLAEVIALAGQKARAPMLWLYAENDKYWGSTLPRRWHSTYEKGGGKAELVMFPPVGEDGHKLIGEGFSQWRPHVDRFLGKLGFKTPRSDGAPMATGFAPLAAADKVPFLNDNGRTEGYAKFLAGDVPRAFAIAPTGAWGASWAADSQAPALALERCRKHVASGCQLYAVDDAVVWAAQPAAKSVATKPK